MKNETVNWDNYEEYLLLQVDGELNESGRQALQAFISANPEVAEELSMYEGVKLVPDATITFAGKETLLKREPKVIVLPSRKWLYAVAAILAGIAIMLPMFWKSDVSTQQLAYMAEKQVRVPVQPAQTVPTKPDPNIPPVLKPHSSGIAKVAPVKAVAIPQQIAMPQEAPLTALDANAALQQIPTSHSVAIVGEQVLPIVQTTVAIIGEVKEQEARKPIHLAAQNAAAFHAIKNAVATNVEKIERTSKLFKETALNLRMGGKNITINF